MSQTFVGKRTSTPDSSSGHILATIASQGDNTILLPLSVLVTNSIGTKPSAHRSISTTGDTSTDMSSSGFGAASGLYEINNDGSLIVWGECSISSGAITCVPIYYDSAGSPLFEGSAISLNVSNRRVSSAGNFIVTAVGPLDTRGTDKVRLYVLSAVGNWDLYLISI